MDFKDFVRKTLDKMIVQAVLEDPKSIYHWIDFSHRFGNIYRQGTTEFEHELSILLAEYTLFDLTLFI